MSTTKTAPEQNKAKKAPGNDRRRKKPRNACKTSKRTSIPKDKVRSEKLYLYLDFKNNTIRSGPRSSVHPPLNPQTLPSCASPHAPQPPPSPRATPPAETRTASKSSTAELDLSAPERRQVNAPPLPDNPVVFFFFFKVLRPG
jgi:hypothetical protein